MYSGEEKIEITKEEFKMIEKSMKEEKFHDLLGEYMEEISDPKNVKEQNEYFEQLKREGEIPKEISFIKPNKGFVIRSTLGSKKDRKFSQKIYINVCSSEKVKESEGKMNKDNEGMRWSCPYFLGKSRYNQDENKEIVTVVDILFHDHALELCKLHLPFKNMIAETSIDAISKLIKEKNEIINKDYEYLEKLLYKGDISLLPINLTGKQIDRKEDKPKSYYEMMKNKEEAKKEKKKEEIIEGEEEVNHEEIKQIEIEKYEGSQLTPKYDILYSYPVDYLDCLDNKEKPEINIPKFIKIKINLPLVKNFNGIKIDVKEKYLNLEYNEKIENENKIIYFLNINFNHKVNKKNCKAKFEKEKKILILELPIIKNIINLKKNKIEENKDNDIINDNDELDNKIENKENDNINDNEEVENKIENKENEIIKDNNNNIEVNNDNLINNEINNKKIEEIEEKNKDIIEDKESEINEKVNENIGDNNKKLEILENKKIEDKPEEKIENDNNLEIIKEFNKQKIDDNLFITLYLKNYIKQSIKYYNLNKIIFINYENKYFYIEFNDDINCEFKFITDYISIIITSKNINDLEYNNNKLDNINDLKEICNKFEKDINEINNINNIKENKPIVELEKKEVNNENKLEENKNNKKENSINQIMFPILKTSKYINQLI